MMQIQTADGMKPLPRKWSFWQHKKNRTIYQVTEVSNLGEKQGDYPVTITYMAQDGQPWSLEAKVWYDKMEPLTESIIRLLNQHEGQVITPSLKKTIVNALTNMMVHTETDFGPKPIKFKPTPVFVPGGAQHGDGTASES